jgi:hypothetical protein
VLVRGPKPDHVKVSTAQHRLQPSNQRGAVVQISPVPKFGTLVLVPLSGRAAR